MADLAEHIQIDIKSQTQVKADFIQYLGLLGSDPSPTLIKIDSHLSNDAVWTGIRMLVNQRETLKQCVGVFPVFVEYGVIQTTLSKHQKAPKKCPKELKKIDKNASLAWFLETALENNLLNNSFNTCQQWIIPLLINEHYCVAVVNKESFESKTVMIQFYDPYGTDLAQNYRNQLKAFFKRLGYLVKYRCVSRPEQKDNHNCGVFVMLKSIELACANVGSAEQLLAIQDANRYDYQKRVNQYRYNIGKLLKHYGENVVIGDCLKKTQENEIKVCF
ncbi:MAG: hypothetical protein JSR17_07660 [Proteobacteria bacterium]|nr:hypothetical protein [Pseudomonadota bacterium]